MKRDIDFPKYINRFVGSVCILAAVALLIMAPIIQIDGVKSKDLRSVQTVVKEVIDAEAKWLLDVVPNSDAAPKPALGLTYTMPLETESMIVVSNIDLWYDLEDHDLPHTASEMKKWFAKIDNIADETLDKKVTLKEVFVLIWNVPGFAKDAKNLMETEYILDRAIDCMVNCDPDVFGAKTLRANMEKAEEYFDEIRFYGYAAIGMVVLLCLLAIYAVAGNLRDKGRGGKYVLLIIALAVTVGGYVGLPLLTESLQASLQEVEFLKNIELRLTVIPVLASVILIVPMILDNQNRKRAKKAEQEAKTEKVTESIVQAHPATVPVADKTKSVKTENQQKAKPEKPAVIRVNNAELRRKVREELEDYVAKQRVQITNQREIASHEHFLSTTVRGGLIAAAAESACLERARKASGLADELKQKIAWHEEMLEKYR